MNIMVIANSKSDLKKRIKRRQATKDNRGKNFTSVEFGKTRHAIQREKDFALTRSPDSLDDGKNKSLTKDFGLSDPVVKRKWRG